MQLQSYQWYIWLREQQGDERPAKRRTQLPGLCRVRLGRAAQRSCVCRCWTGHGHARLTSVLGQRPPSKCSRQRLQSHTSRGHGYQKHRSVVPVWTGRGRLPGTRRRHACRHHSTARVCRCQGSHLQVQPSAAGRRRARPCQEHPQCTAAAISQVTLSLRLRCHFRMGGEPGARGQCRRSTGLLDSELARS